MDELWAKDIIKLGRVPELRQLEFYGVPEDEQERLDAQLEVSAALGSASAGSALPGSPATQHVAACGEGAPAAVACQSCWRVMHWAVFGLA